VPTKIKYETICRYTMIYIHVPGSYARLAKFNVLIEDPGG
jgi:hypothetical protein